MSEGLLRSSDVKLALSYIATVAGIDRRIKLYGQKGEAVILVGVKQNVKHFFKGLYEANLAAQKEVRGFGHFDIR
jgi:hypothetical protein